MVSFMTRMIESGDDHWFPDQDAPRFVKSPSQPDSAHMNLASAMYSSVRGSLPYKIGVRPSCGKPWCVRPTHLTQFATGRPYPTPDMRKDLLSYRDEFPVAIGLIIVDADFTNVEPKTPEE